MNDYFAYVSRKKMFSTVEFVLQYLMDYHIYNMNVEQYETCVSMASHLKNNRISADARSDVLLHTKDFLNRNLDIYFEKLSETEDLFQCVKNRLRIHAPLNKKISVS